MAHGGLPAFAHFRKLPQELQRQTNQVVKIDALIRAQSLFVAAHDARGHPLVVILGCKLRLGARQACIFPSADGPLPLACGVGIGGAAAVFQDAHHIVGIQNTELRFQAQHMAILSHDAHTQGMKGANHDLLRAFANELARTFAHFTGGFVGEGDGRNALRRQP